MKITLTSLPELKHSPVGAYKTVARKLCFEINHIQTMEVFEEDSDGCCRVKVRLPWEEMGLYLDADEAKNLEDLYLESSTEFPYSWKSY